MAWYEEWFDRAEYELVYRRRDEAEAERMIDLVEHTAEPAPGARVLDVGCGRGRHARILARRGYRVTGIDLSEQAIARAQRLAEDEPPDVAERLAFRVGDMREPVCEACFDGVVNLFTAFGYFAEEAEHLRAVQAMATALRPGGWLVQDFLNAERVHATLVSEDERTERGVTIRQRRWIEENRINKEITLRHNGDRHTFCESVRLLELDDFRRLYSEAGLKLVQTFGDYDGAPHTPESPRLILHAVRAPDTYESTVSTSRTP